MINKQQNGNNVSGRIRNLILGTMLLYEGTTLNLNHQNRSS